jgi:hypothetical protein
MVDIHKVNIYLIKNTYINERMTKQECKNAQEKKVIILLTKGLQKIKYIFYLTNL